MTQRGITIAVNWWFDMVFGKDYIFQQLCFNISRLLPVEAPDKDDQVSNDPAKPHSAGVEMI